LNKKGGRVRVRVFVFLRGCRVSGVGLYIESRISGLSGSGYR